MITAVKKWSKSGNGVAALLSYVVATGWNTSFLHFRVKSSLLPFWAGV